MIRYELGLELALPEPNMALADFWTRESLLASAMRQVALDDEYELRVILPHDADVDCPHDVTEGEMLFIVGDGRGGPIKDRAGFIAEADRIGRSGTLDDALAPFVFGPFVGKKRVMILPKPCRAQIAVAPPQVALHGAVYVPAADLKKLLGDAPPTEALAHFAKLLDFCEESRVVISACQC